MNSHSLVSERQTYDLVIVGYGFAGAIAAIEAHDLGLSVAIFEKSDRPGGISICSGGGCRIATNSDSAFRYLQRTCGGLTPDPVLHVFAEGMTEISAYMEMLGQVNDSPLREIPYVGNYPFEGFRDLGFVQFAPRDGEDFDSLYPHVKGLRGGVRHFEIIELNIAQRGIPVYLNTSVIDLVSSDAGEVTGVMVTQNQTEVHVEGRRGVILACGGFEGSREMQGNFLQGTGILSAAYNKNVGDGVRMAMAVGADLWHMWHYHGTYGIKSPDPSYPYGIRLARLSDWIPGEPFPDGNEMSWIVVDQSGKRYMNEYPPYLHDTGHRPMEYYDPAMMAYPRIPSIMIFDEVGRKSGPIAMPTYNDTQVQLHWSRDNLAEIANGYFKVANTISELADMNGVDEAVLATTIAQWNAACEKSHDTDFGRPGASMMPISSPPFYSAEVFPVLSNTQGGPIHDQHWRVLDVRGEPIAGLYEAGELGGIFGHVYLAGGNVAECYIGAWRAVRHAAGRT